MNITEEELESLDACQSAQDWREACDKIKGVRGHAYPDDWWDKVKLTGMMDRILGRWGGDSQISSTSFNNKTDVINHLFNKRNNNN